GDIEHRDIWEYALNLTIEETAQLVRHAWEVRGIHFDYYFLRENCAYRLLAMLDVARPGLNMSRQSHPLYAIPVDTVRDIAAGGLIKDSRYRPAQHSRIQQMYQQIDETMQQQVLAMIHYPEVNIQSRIAHYPEPQQIQILELAYEISRFKNNNPELDNRLLNLRSELPAKKDQGHFSFQQVAPETGHSSARWFIGIGEKEQAVFYELGMRPALHSLLDPDNGFIKGATISSMDMDLRWYKDTETLRLEKLQLFSVQSLLPVQPWSAPLSTAFAVSLQNRVFEDRADHKALMIDASLGYSMTVDNQLWFVLADASYEYAGEFEKNYMLSLGIRAGVRHQFENSRLLLELQQLGSVAGSKGERQKMQGQYQFEIGEDQAIAVEYQHEDFDFIEQQTARLRYIKYF
ncbi:MAG: DUF4105 domain-containing protein, partial [Gammaproteobacteria bacterium]|nr:DUF4105 domain-containing protein [Gammaproteobacteria bacterium]